MPDLPSLSITSRWPHGFCEGQPISIWMGSPRRSPLQRWLLTFLTLRRRDLGVWVELYKRLLWWRWIIAKVPKSSLYYVSTGEPNIFRLATTPGGSAVDFQS